MPEEATEQQKVQNRMRRWAEGRPWLGWYVAAVVTANFLWTIFVY